MQNRSVDLVVFDLGRVLLRLCDGWAHAARLAGVTRVPLEVSDLNDAARAAWDDLVIRYDRGIIDLDCFAREVAAHRGVEPQDVIRLQECFLQGPYPGAVELIEEILSVGCKTACLSNTADLHWKQVHDRNHPSYLPMDRLSWRFASHLIGKCKPTDEIYQHVEQVTRFKPERIMFFDDLDANIAGAAKRDWRAVKVRDISDPIAEIRVHLADAGVIGA
jgi:putative hydrolase of the HAD superfamily